MFSALQGLEARGGSLGDGATEGGVYSGRQIHRQVAPMELMACGFAEVVGGIVLLLLALCLVGMLVLMWRTEL